MSTLAAQTYLTPAEYINVERKAVTKSEYLSGQIIALGHVYRRVTFSD